MKEFLLYRIQNELSHHPLPSLPITPAPKKTEATPGKLLQFAIATTGMMDILAGIRKTHKDSMRPTRGIGDDDPDPKMIGHYVDGFLRNGASASVLRDDLVRNFAVVVNKCADFKIGWLQRALLAKRGDIADALYASGIYCDGDGVFFRGTRPFSARPADAKDDQPSLWKAIWTKNFLAADFLVRRGARNFAARRKDVGDGAPTMGVLIEAYLQAERAVKGVAERNRHGSTIVKVSGRAVAELQSITTLIHCLAHYRQDLFDADGAHWIDDAVRWTIRDDCPVTLIRMLLKLGAPPVVRMRALPKRRGADEPSKWIGASLYAACTRRNNLQLVKLLCAYGADTTHAFNAVQLHIAEIKTEHEVTGQPVDDNVLQRLRDIKHFLVRSKDYTTPLHYTEVLSTAEVHSFLDDNSDGCRALWAGAEGRRPRITPMECAYFNAYALVHRGLPVPPGLRRMILLSQPFSPKMLPFLPPSDRRRVRELLLACALVSKRTTPALPSLPFQEIWMETIFPFLVDGERGRVAFDQAGALARLVDVHGKFQSFCSYKSTD